MGLIVACSCGVRCGSCGVRGKVVDGTPVGLHYNFDTLVCESGYLIFPHVILIFCLRTELAQGGMFKFKKYSPIYTGIPLYIKYTL